MLQDSRIIEIIAEVVKISPDELIPDSALGSTRGWDSLAHLELVTRLEQESGIRLSPEDSIFAESLADLLNLFGNNKLDN